MPRLSSAPQPRSARERPGASLQHSTCTTLSLHPPSSLIKRSAAACLPGPAKSDHITEVQLETLNGTEARRERCASPWRAAPLWPQPRRRLRGNPRAQQLLENPEARGGAQA